MLESMKKSKLQGFRDDVHWFTSASGHRRRLDHSDCFCNLHGPLNVIIGGAQAPRFGRMEYGAAGHAEEVIQSERGCATAQT